MTEQTVTLALTLDQARALEYIVDDWKDAIDSQDIDETDVAGQNAFVEVFRLYGRIVAALPKSDDEIDATVEMPDAAEVDSDGDDEADVPEHMVDNVEVDLMDAITDAAAAVDVEVATELIRRAGIPVQGLARKATFDGQYHVNVAAPWYQAMADGEVFEAQVDDIVVTLARP